MKSFKPTIYCTNLLSELHIINDKLSLLSQVLCLVNQGGGGGGGGNGDYTYENKNEHVLRFIYSLQFLHYHL